MNEEKDFEVTNEENEAVNEAEEVTEAAEDVVNEDETVAEEAADEVEETAVVTRPEEPPLYSTRVVLTEDLCIDYALYIYVRKSAVGKALGIFAIVMVLVGLYYWIFKGAGSFGIPMMVVGIGYPLLLIVYPRGLGRKHYYENLEYNKAGSTYDFYEDFLIMTDMEGPLQLPYSDLIAVWQSAKSFFLMIDDRQGAIIPKVAGEEGLQQFLANLSVTVGGQKRRK